MIHRVSPRRRVLLVQLPPVGPDGLPSRENHPMGVACLALWASRRSVGDAFEIEILDRAIADEGSDLAILDAIAAARPDVLGITLYVWNVVRSRYLIREAKRLLPRLAVIAGGPEAVSGRPVLFDGGAGLFDWGIDAAVQGEGENAFVNFLAALQAGADPRDAGSFAGTAGLLLPPERSGGPVRMTGPAVPLATLDELGSPYLAGWIDAARDRFLYLETTRGCKFHCTFCRYDADVGGPLKMLSLPRVEEVLRHAVEKGVREVFLLDPTLNQRRDTLDLLRVLDRGNPNAPGGGKTFRYGGELVAELIDEETADLLARAGFHTVEVGLQSTNPETLRLIERFHHAKKFLAGVRLLKERGIRVRVDLIAGMPAETLDSMKKAIDFVAESGIGDDVQVFELMVLPGTALSAQAATFGIDHLDRPPYTVIRTPTMSEEEIAEAVAYSEERLGVSWTPAARLRRFRAEERVDVDAAGAWRRRLADHRRNFLALSARGLDIARAVDDVRGPLVAWLASNPFASVDVILEAGRPAALDGLERLVMALQPGPETLGAAVYRRVWTVVPAEARARIGSDWIERARRFSLVKLNRRAAGSLI